MKKTRQCAVLAVLALALIMAACFDSSQPSGPRSYTERPLDGRVVLSIEQVDSEIDSSSAGRLFLRVETEVMQPCMNWSIAGSLRKSGSRLRLSLGNLRVPQICFTAIGPAIYRTELACPAGKYSLDVGLYGRVNRYSLEITDSLVVIDSLLTSFSFVEEDSIRRGR